jgi:polar amino acid transport system substrate-binding protein
MKFAFISEPPFCFISKSGLVTGCDVELARLAFAALGLGELEMTSSPACGTGAGK